MIYIRLLFDWWYRDKYISATPYSHLHIQSLCPPDVLKLIHEEVKLNLRANFKETDLFKVFQTDELAVLDDNASEKKFTNLIKLRDAIYSEKFRNLVSKITGVNDLTERVDCSTNAVIDI